MGVELTFRERGELKTMQRGGEGRKVRYPVAGWVCLLLGASKQEQQEDRRTARDQSPVSRGGALSLAALSGVRGRPLDVDSGDV